MPSPIDIESATVNAAVATAVRPSERRMNPAAIFPGRPPRRVSIAWRAGPRSTSASPVHRMSPSRIPNEPAIPATTPAPGSASTPRLAAASAQPASAAARAPARSPRAGARRPSSCTGTVRARTSRGASAPSSPATQPRPAPAAGIHHDQTGGDGRRKK